MAKTLINLKLGLQTPTGHQKWSSGIQQLPTSASIVVMVLGRAARLPFHYINHLVFQVKIHDTEPTAKKKQIALGSFRAISALAKQGGSTMSVSSKQVGIKKLSTPSRWGVSSRRMRPFCESAKRQFPFWDWPLKEALGPRQYRIPIEFHGIPGIGGF